MYNNGKLNAWNLSDRQLAEDFVEATQRGYDNPQDFTTLDTFFKDDDSKGILLIEKATDTNKTWEASTLAGCKEVKGY